MQELSLLPSETQFAQMKEIANMGIKSGLLPTAIKTPEAAMIIALKGFELGLPPMLAWSNISVIAGKPTIGAELMLSYIYQKYPNADIDIIERSEERCIIKAKRPGRENYTEFKWDMDKARKMGLDQKDNYKKQPGTMYFWRTITEMKRAIFPEVLQGIDYSPDELEDTRDVTNSTGPKPLTQSDAPASEPKTIKNFAPQTSEEAHAMNAEREAKTQTAGTKVETPSREDIAKQIAAIQKLLGWDAKMLASSVDTWFNKSPKDLTTQELFTLLEKMETERKQNGQ